MNTKKRGQDLYAAAFFCLFRSRYSAYSDSRPLCLINSTSSTAAPVLIPLACRLRTSLMMTFHRP